MSAVHRPSVRVATVLFFLSGATALACETTWFRLLTLAFGAALPATGTVLAVFMLGLALGGELAARVADRTQHPARVYACLEATVAACALAAPAVLSAQLDAAAHATVLQRVLGSFGLLALPTLAMGASLPLLVVAVVPDVASLRRGVARLYGANLLGGAVGCALAGFVLVPRYGVRATSVVTASTAMGVALVALTLPGRASTRTLASDAATPPAWGPLALLALVGALSFTLQVAWNRAFALLLGSSAYTFTLVVCAVLCSTALGGFASRAPPDALWPALSRRAITLGISVYLGMLLVHVAPFPLAQLARGGASMRLARVLFVVLLVAVPSYQIGATFPMLAALVTREGVGRGSGRAVLASALGNALGSLVGAFALVPHAGLQRTLVVAASAALAVAIGAAIPSGVERTRAVALACVVAVALGGGMYPRWNPIGLSAGTFRVAAYRDDTTRLDAPCGPDRRFTRNEVLFFREGETATVAAFAHGGRDDCTLYSLRINGKAEGSVFVRGPLENRVVWTRPVVAAGDLPTEVLAGWLPGMAGPRARRAMLIGWGTGISARALLETGVEQLEAVEIERAVLDAAVHFDAPLLSDPRVHFTVDDARIVLRRVAPQSYDVIASHPSNPWVSGASSLFSREYFALARSRLRAGGRFLAWLQLYDTDREVVAGIVATFLAEFPDAHAFLPRDDTRDLLLLGFRSDAPTSVDTLAQRFGPRHDGSTAQRERAGFATLADLMARHVADGAGLARLAQGARVNTEDDGWVEFRVADHLLAGDGEPPSLLLDALRR